MQRATLSALIATLATAGCAENDSREEVGVAASPVWDGDDSVVDTPNDYGYVVALAGTEGTNPFCSGVLITPWWVLTAAHCADIIGTNGDVDVLFNFNPTDSEAPLRKSHTFNGSNPVLQRIVDPVPADLNHTGQDVAVFRLDERIPDGVARPIHFSLTADVCPSGFPGPTGFTGTSIGFGGDFPNDSPCGPIEEIRRYSTHDGWFRLGQADGAVYNKTFFNSLALCSEYSGFVKGDSGGAFVDESGHLCGVISNLIPPIPLPPPPSIPFGFNTSNRMAAVDSEETIEWLLGIETPDGHRVVDAEGNFDGECDDYEESCGDGDCNDEDLDGDEIVDVCDLCPFTDNTLDTDGDGVVDCSDPCPEDAIDALALACDGGGDFDCDGTCDGVDDCPFVANAGHRNSNKHAEQAWNAATMADGCEPIPLPDGDPRPHEVLASQSLNSGVLTAEFQHVRQDKMTIRPLRSRRSRFKKTGPLDLIPPSPIATEFRFCQYDPTRTSCDDPALVHTMELHRELATANEEENGHRYHRVKMSFQPGLRGAEIDLTYDDSPHVWRWLYNTDAFFWDLTGIIGVPEPEDNGVLQGGQWSGLNGRFWVHAATQFGTDVDAGTGTHSIPGLDENEELASRYFDLDPEYLTDTQVSKPFQLSKPLFLWQTLSDPPPDRYRVIEGVNPGDSEIVVRVEGDNFGLLNLSGDAQLLEGHLGPALRNSLASESLVWTTAAEPSAFIGASDTPMALGLAQNGLRVEEQVQESAGALLGQADRGIVGATSLLDDDAPGLFGFTPVYSRTLQTVFLLGGQDAAGRRNRTIQRGSPGLLGWAELVPPVRLGQVIAATYSYRTKSLYLLDRRHATCDGDGDEDACEDACGDDHSTAVVRFIRVDAIHHGGEVIAAWDADALPEDAWLGSDLEGHIVFSFSRQHHHAIVRFDVDQQSVARLHQGPHPLALPVLVDANGFVIYTRRPNNEIRGKRFQSLTGASYCVADLDTLL